MARTQIDIITCDRCGRRLEEADVKTVEFSILHHDPHKPVAPTPQAYNASLAKPVPTQYQEVCARCDTLLGRLAADAATPSKPGRPRKQEKEEDD